MNDDVLEKIYAVIQNIDERLKNIETRLDQNDRDADFYPDGIDPLFNEAVRAVTANNKASASLFQRHLQIGYARAARILDQLERAKIVGPGEGANPRKIYKEEAEKYLQLHQQVIQVEKIVSVSNDPDPLLHDVVFYAVDQEKISASQIQRQFGIGYARAARIMDMLDKYGVIQTAGNRAYQPINRTKMKALLTLLDNSS